MDIETQRLRLRDLMEQDAEALFEIINDEQVRKHPFFQGDETIEFITNMIAFFQSVKSKGLIIDDRYPERGHLFGICLQDSADVIGVISLHPVPHSDEWHMGWYLKSQYTGQGYAAEAGAAASDYFLEALSLEFITAGVAGDNPASFRTAQKSGFTLMEKRIGNHDQDNGGKVEDFQAGGECFANKQKEIESSHYYFRKLNPNAKAKSLGQTGPEYGE